jgi:hypothetical protein
VRKIFVFVSIFSVNEILEPDQIVDDVKWELKKASMEDIVGWIKTGEIS